MVIARTFKQRLGQLSDGSPGCGEGDSKRAIPWRATIEAASDECQGGAFELRLMTLS